ncbi:ubiquitin carboxyl-terminal hydrolase 36-like isoform X2 [Penaeus indicus]
MPASSAEVIGAALQSAFQHKPADTAPSSLHKKNHIEDQLVASSKQVLLNHVEYDRVGTQQSMVLTSLKTKYVNLTASATTTPDSPPGSMAHAQHHKQSSAVKEDQLDDPKFVLWSRDKVTLGWRKTFPPGAGMVNLGNTCYMNSSLQALFHIPAMANWLLEDLSNHTQRCEANSSNASYCSVCAMMRTLRQTLDRSNNVIKPSLIHHKLKSIGKTLMYGRQEDAHEFIKLLLDHMEKSYLSFRRATKLDHRSKETTPLNQIFGGYLRQQVICPLCRHVSTTFSHFQDLVLDIRSVNSVDEALNLHFRKETLDADNAYKCERCHKKVPATKRHLIERAPHVLLIQLKRFTYSGGKISKHINIQKTIDISRFVNGVQKQGGAGSGPYQYRLTSMVIHIGGSQHGGHYTAVAESSSGTMFEFDDSSVRSISVQSALLRNPYILFYEMVRKPKDQVGIKQVVRQSSEKALIRQNSDGIPKPLPTSHSASSVTNGYGRVTDSLGEAITKNGHQAPNKPPLPTHKERDKISFGLKFNQSNSKSDGTSKPNKIILKPGTTSLLGTKSSASSNSLFSSKPSVSSLSTSSPPSSTPNKNSAAQKPLSSLVPYLDDSEESESDDSKRGPMNGHKEKSLQNGKAKCDEHQKNVKENGVKMNGCLHNKNVEKSANSDNKSSKNNDSESGAKSSISSNKGGITAPFLPRSLQVITSANQLHTSSESSKGKSDLGWTVSDAALHSPSESSNSSAGGCHAASFTVVDQPTSSKNDQIKHQPQELEKLQHQGWTVTVRRQRPELEKSHSHDSVLPGPSHKKDEPDSASLRSKASVDSTRSDRSTKSMKKSIFSLFTCVTSARSPDSPEDDQPEALPPHSETQQGSKSKHPEGQAKLAEPEEDLPNDTMVLHNPSKCKNKATNGKQNVLENGHALGKGDADSEADAPQSKRIRDRDDNEPSSPSKKCRPEDKMKVNKKSENDLGKNGSVSSVPKNGLSNNYDKSKNVQCSDPDSSKNGVTHESVKTKNGYADGGERENSKSGKSKKEGKSVLCNSGEAPKATLDSSSSASASSLTGSSDSESSEGEEDPEGTEHWVEKTKETVGKAKINPNAHVVHWNGSLKDLSHTLIRDREKDGPKEFEKRKTGMWDGSRDTDVVDELRRAGSFAFGTKVNSWGGNRGAIDQEFQKERNEAKKRTADDLYNEEFDRGRTKKVKKSKKPWEDNQRWDRGNAFQKVQDYRNSGSWTPHNNYQNQYANSSQHFNNHYSREQYWDRNRDRHHQRYNNNNKPWNKFHKREHKFHKKHKEKYKHWDRRD